MLKLKSSIYISFIILVITFSIFIKEGKVEGFIQKNELLEMIEVAQQQNIEIKKWSMLIKQPNIQYDDMDAIGKKTTEIQANEEGFIWTKEPFDGEQYKIVGEKKSKGGSIIEKIKIIYYPTHDKYSLSVIYEVKGTNWNEENWDALSKQYQAKIKQYSTFYTIEGVTKLTQSLQTEAGKLLQAFSSEAVESLKEDDFVSISAYTNQWKAKLSLGNEKFMNLHIALRNANHQNGLTNVTIGTPIITSEY